MGSAPGGPVGGAPARAGIRRGALRHNGGTMSSNCMPPGLICHRAWRVALLALLSAMLLLKAAMPWLATAAAQAQGKALVEVCTVYGIARVALDAGDAPAAPSSAAHVGDHCLLSGGLVHLAALPPEEGSSTALRIVVNGAAGYRGQAPLPLPDASARWAAGLAHGPPRAGV